jgi:hypothetical protein
MGPVLDMVVVSRAVVGASYEELGRRVNMGLPHPFTALGKGSSLRLIDYTTAGL